MEDDKQRRAERDALAAGENDGGTELEDTTPAADTKADTSADTSADGRADTKADTKAKPAKSKKSAARRSRNQKSARATQDRPIDHVRVADGALRSIIGLAAHEVPGVVGMAPVNIGEGLRRILGARQVDEGVSVEHPHGESRADVDIHVVVAYGVNIPVVAEGVRERVRYAARQFAGVKLDEVRVHVEGVSRG